ncbi:MAG: HAD-IIIC family phosphatase [Clostridiales bacterium]|jgi:FkbH-like protein|nr:HAD-IIIC family phosphatase [Clostridiales bacterium]
MIKCIVWDLDDTLWQGTLGESFENEPSLNQTAVKLILEADARGVFQSIASRSDREKALGSLNRHGLGKYFINPLIAPYLHKPAALLEAAAHFNIGTDSLAFVDDNPFERYEVSRYVPDARVFDVSEIDVLSEMISGLPEVSSERRVWMRRREDRLKAEKAFTGSREEFLRECKMALSVRQAAGRDFPRINELACRARQINTAYGGENKANMFPATVEAPGSQSAYVCELTDIFGFHGIVGAAVIRHGEGGAFLDLFCVSCRVEGRGIAAAFMGEILRGLKGGEIFCRCENPREGTAFALLKSMGFRVVGQTGGGALLALRLPCAGAGVSWINVTSI